MLRGSQMLPSLCVSLKYLKQKIHVCLLVPTVGHVNVTLNFLNQKAGRTEFGI